MWAAYYRSLEALFRKHYKKNVSPGFDGDHNHPRIVITKINKFARHLGLEKVQVLTPLDYKLGDFVQILTAPKDASGKPPDPIEYENKNGLQDWCCILLGHYREGEEL